MAVWIFPSGTKSALRSRWLPLLILAAAVAASPPPAAADTEQGQSAEPASVPEGAASFDDYDPLFDEIEIPVGFPDPWERTNRAFLIFNRGVDTVVLNPITKVYSFLVPDRVRQAFRCFFANVSSPSVLLNDLLQLEWQDAGVTLSRFAINTTIGVVGFFDPAVSLGLERHRSDFGQTLALSGMQSGPYLVVPIFGPSTARDGFGLVIDTVVNPALYLLGPLSVSQLAYAGSSGISLRDAEAQNLEALEATSIDFYAALHSAYSQNRRAEIWSRREHRRQ